MSLFFNSWFDTEISFKNLESIYTRSFEMNRQQSTQQGVKVLGRMDEWEVLSYPIILSLPDFLSIASMNRKRECNKFEIIKLTTLSTTASLQHPKSSIFPLLKIVPWSTTGVDLDPTFIDLRGRPCSSISTRSELQTACCGGSFLSGDRKLPKPSQLAELEESETHESLPKVSFLRTWIFLAPFKLVLTQGGCSFFPHLGDRFHAGLAPTLAAAFPFHSILFFPSRFPTF